MNYRCVACFLMFFYSHAERNSRIPQTIIPDSGYIKQIDCYISTVPSNTCTAGPSKNISENTLPS